MNQRDRHLLTTPFVQHQGVPEPRRTMRWRRRFREHG